MSKMKYDIAVVGGGPGGYSAALEAVKYGLSVILFEKDNIGGVCLNKGCVPTKFLLHTGEEYSEIFRLSRYGINADVPSINMSRTQQENYKIIDGLRNSLREFILSNKITIVPYEAEIVSKNTIKSCNELYEAKNIIIATGSIPRSPFVNGAVTSDELLKFEHIPESFTIIGGGSIAVEFASIFSNFGSKVTIKIRGERLLRKMDKEIAIGAAQILKKQRVIIKTKCSLEDLADNDSEIVLSAVGRVPVLPRFANVSPCLGDDGGIIVDNFGMTSVKGIYAVGDVIAGSPQLAHTAMEQGRRAAQQVAGITLGEPSAVVSCIYIRPEIASVGLSESEARVMGINCICAKQTMYSNARTLIANPERGFVKIVAEADSGKIIGTQLICERAGDIIAEIALAINNEITVSEFCRTVHPHPSFCEAVFETAEILKNKLMKKGQIL